MADSENLETEAILFAEDLFSNLMSRHPMFRAYLPEHFPTLRESSPFTDVVGKAVMVVWQELRNVLENKFRSEFNSFSKGGADLNVYLKHLCDWIRISTSCKLGQVLGLSAILLELISFLYRRGYTYFLYSAPNYWFLMFKTVAYDEFYKVGGWNSLISLSKEQENNYDNSVDEIYWKYWALNSNQSNVKSSTGSSEESSGIVTDFVAENARLETVSKNDTVGVDLKVAKSSKGPVIKKTLKLVKKQSSKEMSPKSAKMLDSKEKGSKLTISEGKDASLVKKTQKQICPRHKDVSKKDAISDIESKSSAPTDRKHISPRVAKTLSYPGTLKCSTPEKAPSYKMKTEGTSSSFEKSSSTGKLNFVTIRCKSALPKSENVPATSTQSASKPAKPCIETITSDETTPAKQGVAAAVITAPEQKASQTTQPGVSNISSKEKSKKSTPTSTHKRSPSKKGSKDSKPLTPWR